LSAISACQSKSDQELGIEVAQQACACPDIACLDALKNKHQKYLANQALVSAFCTAVWDCAADDAKTWLETNICPSHNTASLADLAAEEVCKCQDIPCLINLQTQYQALLQTNATLLDAFCKAVMNCAPNDTKTWLNANICIATK
jgi:hypothetical protein